MENKIYYTPDILEYHPGFECEVFCTNKWQSVKLPLYDGLLNTLLERIKEKSIRVKYLDKNDVESLGYGFRTFLWGFESSDGNIIIEVEDIDDLQKGTIDIYCVQDLRFKGRIKNKSEMAKLLKQLEI